MVEAGLAQLSARDPERGKSLRSATEEHRLRQLSYAALDSEFFDPLNPELAEASLRLSMQRGSLQAALDLGELYRDGDLGQPDIHAALKLFDGVRSEVEPAVRAGDWAALLVMGRMHADGLGVEPNRQRGMELTLRGVASATPTIKRSIGWAYHRGSGVFKGRANEDEGLRLIEEAARAGDVDAMENAALLIATPHRGSNMPRESSEAGARALGWYVKAAQLGRVESMAAAGDLAWDRGDFATAEKWLEAAYQAGKNKHPEVLGTIQMMRSALPVARTAPGVEQLVKALTTRSEYDAKLSGWRMMNAYSAERAAMDGMAISRDDPTKLARAALVAQAWVFVRSAGLRRAWPDDALKEYLLKIDRGSRSALVSEARRLADILLAASDGLAPPEAHAPLQAQASASLPATRQPTNVTAPEPQPQDRSGYLRGAPRDTHGGLSTFTIDNRKGTAGSTVRLYRNGELPAAYSFFVKQTETFTGTAIAPGNYVMRYRNLGSPTVYEADKTVAFKESELADGTQYSRATVTLFPVASGNMKMKPVAESKF